MCPVLQRDVIMACHVPGCLGNYDFDEICAMARRRFLRGEDTVSLLKRARSQREREEVVLVSLLDLDDGEVRALHLSCPHGASCRVTDCRRRLKALLEREGGATAAPQA
ncbi:hypothetical protein [Motiliproteus sp. SC1-56]|uniref:hypothetical protein n=1 Tax=Motiliproteus sp. SC1-56 TaxID=2799565 RepID=UPI001A8D2CD5|nr:hypothetical protein [Motiliproteus sp. SC1-56]